MKILLGVTGSVAASLVFKFYQMLVNSGHHVKMVFTEHSLEFLNYDSSKLTLSDIGDDYRKKHKKGYPAYFDANEYSKVYDKTRPICHIELRDWADVFVICPVTANTISKMASGVCDNLLTSIFRAWPLFGPRQKPVYLAPAMNTTMWRHPLTAKHLTELIEMNVNVIYPEAKRLACGSFGQGGLADLSTIQKIVEGHRWGYPLNTSMNFFPVHPHLGSFAAERTKYMHTGVDLYTYAGSNVYAVEDGVVVKTGQYTGAKVGSPYYNDTNFVSVEGKSGIICYGELDQVYVKKGAKIEKGYNVGTIGVVLKELPKLRPYDHQSSMLHLELLKGTDPAADYKFATHYWAKDWELGKDRVRSLLDPTPYLHLIMQSRYRQASVENKARFPLFNEALGELFY